MFWRGGRRAQVGQYMRVSGNRSVMSAATKDSRVTYGALGLSRKTCRVEEFGSKRPEEARCRWKMAPNELPASLSLDSGVSGSTALSGGGSSVCIYDANNEDRDISVFIVVLCVTVEVSRDTMTLAGSTFPEGGDERRIGSKGGCGGDAGRLAGSAGTGGNESRTLIAGRRLGVLGMDEVEPSSESGAGGIGRVGREGVDVREGVGSASSTSSTSGIGGSGGLLGLEGEYSEASSISSSIASTSDSNPASSASCLGPAKASCGVRTTIAPAPRVPLRLVMVSNALWSWGSDMRIGFEGA